MSNPRLIRILIACLIGLVFAAAIAWWTVQQERRTDSVQAAAAGMVVPGVSVGGPFSLTDHTGARVTEASYAGRFRLMYFGFTFCPDFCPTDLQTFARTMEMLGGDAESVQPLFVTIDPERDTPAQLKEYVALFHPSLVGLTGTAEETAAIAKAFRVYYAKAPGGDAQSYSMDHSTYIYLMGRDGAFLTLFRHGTQPEEIAATIRSFLKTQG